MSRVGGYRNRRPLRSPSRREAGGRRSGSTALTTAIDTIETKGKLSDAYMMEAERMDTLLTTVVGGFIVATVGAVHAFYFGGVRERQRRLREEQEVSSERRTQAIIEIIARAQKVVTGV